MTGGEVCPICTSATKYQYIMEELVEAVKQLKEQSDLRDEELNKKIDEQYEKLGQRFDNQFKWIVGLVVMFATMVIGWLIDKL